MTSDTIILISQFVILAVLIGMWLYLHFHHRYLKGVNSAFQQKTEALLAIQASEQEKAKLLGEKTDLLLESQEGGRKQISAHTDDMRHQQSKVMDRMQSLVAWYDKLKAAIVALEELIKGKNNHKDPPP